MDGLVEELRRGTRRSGQVEDRRAVHAERKVFDLVHQVEDKAIDHL